ncbi:unnamed protein product, partial [Laminaria digitata]
TINNTCRGVFLCFEMLQIRATLGRRRLSIQLGFQDFDRKGEGHVSVGQLKRVLCSFGVLPADNRTQELLEKR